MAGTDKDNKQNGRPDEWDMLIAYHLLKKDMDKQNTPKKNSGSECSNLEAILYTVGGFVVMSIILTSLGIDAHDVPVLLIIFLWIVFGIIIMVVVNCIGSGKR